MVTGENNNYTLLHSGIGLSVSVGIRSLIVAISVPEEFRNQMKGLLGNYNKVKDDDFILPDGTVLSDTLTDRQLHQQFGNACKSLSLVFFRCMVICFIVCLCRCPSVAPSASVSSLLFFVSSLS